MNMNYCGRCGAANGTAARYCRQCGVELHKQQEWTASSSSSSPSGVEFSARNTAKGHLAGAAETPEAAGDSGGREIPPPPPTPPPYPKSPSKPLAQASAKKDDNQDPKSISESLKKLRTTGSLLSGDEKKKQERINEIIAESVGDKVGTKPVGKATASKTKAKLQSVAPPPEPTGRRRSGKSSGSLTSMGNQRGLMGMALRKNLGASLSATPSGMTSTAAAPAPGASRNTGSLSSVSGADGASALQQTPLARAPLGGPSSVLAQASGLGKPSKLGSRLRLALIVAIIVMATGGYFLLRDRLNSPARLADAGRNLLSAEEQSAYLVRLAQREREQGHVDDAIGYFQNALSLTPNNPDTQFLLAQTYHGAGRDDEAMKNYQALLKIVPDHLEARLQVAEIHRARGNWNAALAEYQRIIAYDQTSPQATVALSIMESQEQGKPEVADAAIGNYEGRRPLKSVKKTPVALPRAIPQAKISLLPTGSIADRMSALQPPAPASRPEEKPDPRAAADGHKKLGLRYFNVRQYRAAINEFLSALRLTPEDKDVYYFLGSSYFGLGELAQAHDYYKRVDSGNYVGVAQSGAARTEKAAREREESRRREMLRNGTQNQVKNEFNQKSRGPLNNSLE